MMMPPLEVQYDETTGRMTKIFAPSTYEQALDHTLAEIRAIIIRRHRRYGMNLLRHGEKGILVRIDDKTERISNMLEQGEDDPEEPRSQTWQDIAGYATQAIMIERGHFILKMEAHDAS